MSSQEPQEKPSITLSKVKAEISHIARFLALKNNQKVYYFQINCPLFENSFYET